MLAERFALHRQPTDAAATIRAIVGNGMSMVGADLITALPALKIIAIHGAGYAGLDLAPAHARHIRVNYTPDVLTPILPSAFTLPGGIFKIG